MTLAYYLLGVEDDLIHKEFPENAEEILRVRSKIESAHFPHSDNLDKLAALKRHKGSGKGETSAD